MWNLKVEVNNQLVVIDKALTIPFKLLSPLFNELGDHTLDFSFPKEGNELIFNNPHRLTSRRKPNNTYNMRITFDCFVIEGLFTLTDAGTLYTGYMITGIGNIIDRLKDESLNAINSFDTVYLGSTYEGCITNLKDVSDGNTDLGFELPTVSNPDLYGSANENFMGLINRYDVNNRRLEINRIAEYMPLNWQTVCPMPKFWFVLEKMFEYLGYTVDSVFKNDDDLSKIIMLSLKTLDFKERKWIVNVGLTSPQNITNGNKILFNDITTPPYEDLDDCWNMFNNGYLIRETGYYMIEYILTVTSYDVQQEMYPELFTAEMTFVTVSGSEVKSQTVHEGLFNNTEVRGVLECFAATADIGKWIAFTCEIENDRDGVSKATIDGFASFRYSSFLDIAQVQRSFNIQDHLPNVPLIDLLNTARAFGKEFFFDYNTFNCTIKSLDDILNAQKSVDWNNNTINQHNIDIIYNEGTELSFSFDSADSFPSSLNNVTPYYYKGEYDKLSDVPVPDRINETAYIKTTGEIYTSFFNDETYLLEWQHSSHIFNDLTITNKDISLSFPFAPILMYSDFYFKLITGNQRPFIVPTIKQTGTSLAFDTGVNDFGIRLMNYFGWIYETHPPFASSLNYDYDGTLIGNLALTWQGTYGLYEKYWKRWVEWRRDRARPVTLKRLMTSEELNTIRFWNWYEMNNIQFLLDSVEFDLRDGHQPVATIRAWVI